jgi:hypothetical protein
LTAALAALIAMRDKNPDKQMKWADPNAALAYMVAAADEGRCIMHAGYFIMYSVGPIWFSTASFLIEELVIRIYGSSPPSAATDALQELHELHGTVAVISGDTQVGRMTPHYLAAGYQVLGQQFIKE